MIADFRLCWLADIIDEELFFGNMKIKKGDQVLIISGKDRLRKGKVIKVLTQEGKLIIEGLNLAKRHRRPRREGEKGQVVEIPMPLNASNVKFICPKCSKPVRVGYKIVDKNKIRVCKKCGGEI